MRTTETDGIRGAPDEGLDSRTTAERVVGQRLVGTFLIGIAVAVLPLFGPWRVALGASIVVAETVVNLWAARVVRSRGVVPVTVVVVDMVAAVAVVAFVPESLAIAALVLAASSALTAFWYGTRTTMTLVVLTAVGLTVVGIREDPPLWIAAVCGLLVCSTITCGIMHSLSEGMRTTRNRYHELVAGIDAVVWEADRSGQVSYVSDNVADVIGISAEDFADADAFRSRLHPDDLDAWRRARAANWAGDDTEVHLRVRDDHGADHRIQQRVKVSRRPDGSIHRMRGVLVDESRRWEAEADNRRYSDFIQGIPVGLVILQLADPSDPGSFHITAMNPAAADLFGQVSLAEGPRLVTDVLEVEPRWMELLAQVSEVGQPFERSFVSLPGAEGVFALRAVPLPDHSVGVSLEDVTKRARLAASFRHQATHDALTGLPNRTQLQSRLESALASARAGNAEVALLLVDLDQFKEVNDALGHEHGDRLLVGLARRLSTQLRQCDLIARLGGDEFAILITDAADATAAREVAERLLHLCEQPFEIGEYRFQVGASVGIALAPRHATDAETLLRRADGAMYRAKENGGGIAVYSPGQDLHNLRRLELLGDLRETVEAFEDIVVHFQPRVDLAGGNPVGVEALVRWNHPRHGILAPDEFIELAEVSGAIHKLTQRVSQHSVGTIWDRLGHRDLTLSINLSTRNLYDPHLVEWVGALLAEDRGPGGDLCFEITESQLMDDPSQAMAVLGELRALGVRFSIDDFGTGYSSLSYLRELPIDEVKIDRSFVADLARDDTIVRSVIDLGHNLDLHVVAEGVEDVATLEKLRDMGCDSAQGFLIGRPMPADELSSWVGGAWVDEVTLR